MKDINIFENKKLLILVMSAILVVAIALLFFPGYLKPAIRPYSGSPQSEEIRKINTQSSDTSLDSLQKDLNETDIENADKELQLIDKEIDAAI